MLSAIIIVLVHSQIFYCLDVIYYALSFPKSLVLYIQLNDSIYLFLIVLFILNVLRKVFKVVTTSSSLLFKLQSACVQYSSPPPQVFSLNLSRIFKNSSSSFTNHFKFVHVYGKLVSILHGLFSVVVYIST